MRDNDGKQMSIRLSQRIYPVQIILHVLIILMGTFSLSCHSNTPTSIPNIQLLEGKPLPEAPQLNTKMYRFTEDMFALRNRIFWQSLSSVRGKPDIHYLEVGVHEGRALLWMLEHILTHPSSTLTGIDLFSAGEGDFSPKEIYHNPDAFKDRYFQNIRSSQQEHRIKTHIGYSQEVMKTLSTSSFDIIYIDGCHTLACTREDTRLAWGLLKNNGFLLIDDYSEHDFPAVHQAAQELYAKYGHNMNVIHTGWVLVLQKQQ